MRPTHPRGHFATHKQTTGAHLRRIPPSQDPMSTRKAQSVALVSGSSGLGEICFLGKQLHLAVERCRCSQVTGDCRNRRALLTS